MNYLKKALMIIGIFVLSKWLFEVINVVVLYCYSFIHHMDGWSDVQLLESYHWTLAGFMGVCTYLICKKKS